MVDGRDLRRVAHDATVHSGHGGGGTGCDAQRGRRTKQVDQTGAVDAALTI